MVETIMESLNMIFAIALVIILTHSIFFIAYGYCMSGDPFIALKNFYNVMYHMG